MWQEGPTYYGASIIDYRIFYDQGIDDFVELASDVTDLFYTLTSIVTGTNYKFKVQARSEYGYSLETEELTVLAAEGPEKPDVPSTAVSGANVVFSWTAPADNGSPIIAYQVMIRHVDGITYGEDLTYCDGSENSIMTAAQCSVPINTLRTVPYNLNWGDSIYIKIAAINQYGNSEVSDVGNGAIILTNPDAPLSLVEDYSTKTESRIGLTWQDGAANGGSSIIDYRVSFDQGLGTEQYVVLQSGVLTRSYVADGLTPGETYKFKV
jgi:hypothetical protein